MNRVKKLFHALLYDRNKIKLLLLYKFSKFYSDEKFLRKLYRLRMGKELDLGNPQTFSEKLQWLKLHNRKPEYSQMVDKVEAKKYVANIIGEEYIIPTLGVYNTPDEIDFDALPDQFVLKCTHDSGGLVVCKDKHNLDFVKTRERFKKWLKTNYYYQNREWPYKNVRPRIIAEQYMEDENDRELKDYKFFCFDGEPKLCQIIAGRQTAMTIDFYDKDWIHQDFHEPRKYPFAKEQHLPPKEYEKMWKLASKLSQGHPFIRVDFYDINGEVFFGELTFFPTSGMGGFDPEVWDYIFGDWIKLPNTSNAASSQ